MAFFIISKNGVGDVFEMDATVSHSYTLTGKPTNYAVESGSNKSDHYTKDLIQLNYSGIVSDVKYAKGVELSLSVSDFEEGIVSLRDSGEFFACSFSENTSIVKNCLFSSLTINRSPDHGKYAISVSFSVKQVEVVDVAEVVTAPEPFKTFADSAEVKKKGASSTDQPKKEEDKIWKRSLNSVAGSKIF